MFVHVLWLQGWDWAPQRLVKRVQANRAKWQQAGLELKLWDESMILQLLSSSPKLKAWFLSLQTTIAKCDIGRAIILQQYGGLYADADFDPNVTGIQALMKEMQAKNIVLFPKDPAMGLVNNYLIASPPKSPFWNTYLQACASAISSPDWKDVVYALLRPTWPVLSSHGPVLLSRLVQNSVLASPSTLVPSDLGTHGWSEEDGETDSAWYRTQPERLQRRVALACLILACIGCVSTLYFILSAVYTLQ